MEPCPAPLRPVGTLRFTILCRCELLKPFRYACCSRATRFTREICRIAKKCNCLPISSYNHLLKCGIYIGRWTYVSTSPAAQVIASKFDTRKDDTIMVLMKPEHLPDSQPESR
jgi:hypothetical protein